MLASPIESVALYHNISALYTCISFFMELWKEMMHRITLLNKYDQSKTDANLTAYKQ